MTNVIEQFEADEIEFNFEAEEAQVTDE